MKALSTQLLNWSEKMSSTIYDRFDEAYSKELRSFSGKEKPSMTQIQAMTIAAAAEAVADASNGFVSIEDLYILVAGLYKEHDDFEGLLEAHYYRRLQ